MPDNDTPAAVPDTVAGWRELCGEPLVAAQLAARWYAWPDDTIGGWAVMPHDVPPSSGVPTVNSFSCEAVARHVVDLHNATVDQAAFVGRWRGNVRASLALRELVRPGDIVHVPAGADTCVTTSHRILVKDLNNHCVSGPRIKADGTPIESRSVNAPPDGYLEGVAEWPVVRKSTVYRNGEVIYQPEGNA